MLLLLRNLLGAGVAIFAVSWLIPGISYQGDMRVLLSAALVFALFQMLVKPILNLVALPFNLISFGLVSFLINIALFYGISYLVPAFTILPFDFAGFSWGEFAVPAMDVPVAGTAILGALVASIVFAFFGRSND